MNTTQSELEQILKEATEALTQRSPVLEKAPKMSKAELQKNIDERIDKVASGELEGEELEHTKAEARMLAVLKLRRG
jgi:hypothetical protein